MCKENSSWHRESRETDLRGHPSVALKNFSCQKDKVTFGSYWFFFLKKKHENFTLLTAHGPGCCFNFYVSPRDTPQLCGYTTHSAQWEISHDRTTSHMMARWRYLEQWKETFPFVLRSAFSFWNRVLAFGQHFVLGGKYVNDRLPMESLFTTLPRVHAPSLTKDQSDLANPSRGHRNLIKLKAAHSPRREKWQCQHRGREVSGGRGERNLYCSMHPVPKESQKNFSVSCSLVKVF